jgi:hypothetical protein
MPDHGRDRERGQKEDGRIGEQTGHKERGRKGCRHRPEWVRVQVDRRDEHVNSLPDLFRAITTHQANEYYCQLSGNILIWT